MVSGETMRYSKVRRILRYHTPNRILSSEKFAHHVLVLFYLFRGEKELLSGFPPFYQNKMQEQGAQDIVNINKTKFEPYGDLVDQGYSNCNAALINNQNPHSQTENDETAVAEYPNENDSEDTETNKNCPISNFMPKILPDDEIGEKNIFKFNVKLSLSCGSIHELKIM